MIHTTKKFKAKGVEVLDSLVRAAQVTVRYSIDDDGIASVSFSDDKMVMLQVLVDENFKKMAKELLKWDFIR